MKKECKCDMRTKLVGDGCETCNPEKALEYASQTIADLKQERDELAAQVEVMREALDKVLTTKPSLDFDIAIIRAKEALSITPSAAPREIQARALEEVARSVVDEFDRAMILRRAESKRKGE